ncbi:MAG: Flagellar basal-body rod protein FlgC [Holosporales bacterium]
MKYEIDSGSLIKGLHVATSGMIAQNKKLLAITQNIANAGSRSDVNGMPYARKTVKFTSYFDKKLGAELIKVEKIKADKNSFRRVHSPNDPLADKDGYVLESNVNTIVEMSDMREAGRSHKAATKAYEKILQMLQNMLGLLKQ